MKIHKQTQMRKRKQDVSSHILGHSSPVVPSTFIPSASLSKSNANRNE